MTLVPEASTGVNSAWAGSAVLVGPRAVPGASTDFFAAALLSSMVQFYVWVEVVPSFIGVCPAGAGAGSAPGTPSFFPEASYLCRPGAGWLRGQTCTWKTRLVSRSLGLNFLVRPVLGPSRWLWLQTKQQSRAKELQTKGFY